MGKVLAGRDGLTSCMKLKMAGLLTVMFLWERRRATLERVRQQKIEKLMFLF